MDLIFGSKATFNSSGFDGILEFLKDYPVHHFSAYGLTIEENTLFHKKIKKKLMELPDQDFQANQYKYIEKNLELLGFRHYELSNYARNDEFCHHNQSIWQGQDYLGIGPSAWGGRYFGKKAIRRQNPANLEDYFKNQNIVSNESNSLDLAQELLLWGLRNYKGANWPFISSCLNDKIGLSELLLRFPFIYEKDQNLHCVKEKWLILDALTAEIFAFFNEKMA